MAVSALHGCRARPVRGCGVIVLSLPNPISVNAMFSNVPGIGRVKSKRYAAWVKEAGWLIRSQRPGQVEPPVSVLIELVPQDKRKQDADNRIKACLDALVSSGVLPDDNNTVVREVTARWLDAGEPCRVTIKSME